jgi:hypothetical protein
MMLPTLLSGVSQSWGHDTQVIQDPGERLPRKRPRPPCISRIEKIASIFAWRLHPALSGTEEIRPSAPEAEEEIIARAVVHASQGGN